MPTASIRCERCGGSVTGGHADERGLFSRLCSTCRAEAERSLERGHTLLLARHRPHQEDPYDE